MHTSLRMFTASTLEDGPSYDFANTGVAKIHKLACTPGAGFMNRRRLCQLTAAILTSDLTTRMWVL